MIKIAADTKTVRTILVFCNVTILAMIDLFSKAYTNNTVTNNIKEYFLEIEGSNN
ncbi:MAG: hypothetical protein ACI8RH_001498 [Flavobacteriales bacterium]|jgi:hypothetical protein